MAASLRGVLTPVQSKGIQPAQALGLEGLFSPCTPAQAGFLWQAQQWGRRSNGAGKRQSKANLSSAMARPAIQAY